MNTAFNFSSAFFIKLILFYFKLIKKSISFDVVSEIEPECEDVGYAFVDIKSLLRSNRNLNSEKIDSKSFRLDSISISIYLFSRLTFFFLVVIVIDSKDTGLIIGKMSVTVEIIDALNAITEELNTNTLTETA
jgi:hypothetical protein